MLLLDMRWEVLNFSSKSCWCRRKINLPRGSRWLGAWVNNTATNICFVHSFPSWLRAPYWVPWSCNDVLTQDFRTQSGKLTKPCPPLCKDSTPVALNECSKQQRRNSFPARVWGTGTVHWQQNTGGKSISQSKIFRRGKVVAIIKWGEETDLT